MNKSTVVLFAVLSMALGGCVTTGVRTTASVYTVSPYEHHHVVPVSSERIVLEASPARNGGRVVSKTTIVEEGTHDGDVVRRTTVVEKVRAVDCSSRNPYRDEFSPRSPCYWKRQVGVDTDSVVVITSTKHLPPNYVYYKATGEYRWYRSSRHAELYTIHRRHW